MDDELATDAWCAVDARVDRSEPEALLALNACSDGGEAPIWRASWNVLMAGKLRIYVRL